MRLTLPALVATLSMSLLAAPAAHADQTDGEPVGVVDLGHRGASATAPESTRDALDQAVAAHADRLSIDVHLTQDGVPIVLHDDSLARTTDVEQKFPRATSYLANRFTLAQIKTLDAGSWFGRTYKGRRVLTLDQALTELDRSPAGLVVEAKEPDQLGGVAGIGKAIMDVVARHPAWTADDAGGPPRLLVESFSWQFLEDMHSAYPDLPLVLLGRAVTASDVQSHPYVREADTSSITGDLVAVAHQLGIRVDVWTLDDRTSMERAITAGADGIVSDDPALLRSILAGHGSTWSGTVWPSPTAVRTVALTGPRHAVLGRRISVRVRVVDPSGSAVRWRTLTLQSWGHGRWRTVASRATSAAGSVWVSLPASIGMRVRAVAGGRASAAYRPIVRR